MGKLGWFMSKTSTATSTPPRAGEPAGTLVNCSAGKSVKLNCVHFIQRVKLSNGFFTPQWPPEQTPCSGQIARGEKSVIFTTPSSWTVDRGGVVPEKRDLRGTQGCQKVCLSKPGIGQNTSFAHVCASSVLPGVLPFWLPPSGLSKLLHFLLFCFSISLSLSPPPDPIPTLNHSGMNSEGLRDRGLSPCALSPCAFSPLALSTPFLVPALDFWAPKNCFKGTTF